MRVKKVIYNNKENLIIYITPQEKIDDSIAGQIADLKKTYKDVVVFISGRNSIEKVLIKIIEARVK